MSFPPESLLDGYPERIAALGEGLRALVRTTIPEAIEAVRPGWRLIGYDLPRGRRTPFFAWIMPQAAHIHLGFPQGVLIDDRGGQLGGVGETKRARWLTLEPGQPVPVAEYARFVREAARIAGLSSSERGLILVDRELRAGSADT